MMALHSARGHARAPRVTLDVEGHLVEHPPEFPPRWPLLHRSALDVTTPQSKLLVPGDGHPNEVLHARWAERLGRALEPLLPTEGLSPGSPSTDLTRPTASVIPGEPSHDGSSRSD